MIYNTINHFNTTSWMDEFAPEQILLQMQKVLLSLVALLLVKSILNFAYLDNCPWTIDKARQNTFIEQVVHFLRMLVETLFIYVTFMTAIGYAITRAQLSLFEVKIMFGLTSTKFILSQLVSTL